MYSVNYPVDINFFNVNVYGVGLFLTPYQYGAILLEYIHIYIYILFINNSFLFICLFLLL